MVAERVYPLDMARRQYLDNDLVIYSAPSTSSRNSQGRDSELDGQVVKFICLTVDCSY